MKRYIGGGHLKSSMEQQLVKIHINGSLISIFSGNIIKFNGIESARSQHRNEREYHQSRHKFYEKSDETRTASIYERLSTASTALQRLSR